jgi:hypothetical protein
MVTATLVVTALVWTARSGPERDPYAVPATSLANWPLVTSDGTDHWVVGVKPPDGLATRLLDELSRRAGRTLTPPPHVALPLVLRDEFDEGLQGVYGVDSVMQIAHDADIERATFQPICVAHQRVSAATGAGEVYFVAFTSSAFDQVRIDLLPAQPEHAGVGTYEPSTLVPLLLLGATNPSLARDWTFHFDAATDCLAELHVVAADSQ